MTEEKNEKSIYTKEELTELGVRPKPISNGLPTGTKLAGYNSQGMPVVERVKLTDSEEMRAVKQNRTYLVLGSNRQSHKELSDLASALSCALGAAIVDNTLEKSVAADAIREKKYGVVVVVSKGSDCNIEWASAAKDRGQQVAIYATDDLRRIERLGLPYDTNGDDLVKLLVDGPRASNSAKSWLRNNKDKPDLDYRSQQGY